MSYLFNYFLGILIGHEIINGKGKKETAGKVNEV